MKSKLFLFFYSLYAIETPLITDIDAFLLDKEDNNLTYLYKKDNIIKIYYVDIEKNMESFTDSYMCKNYSDDAYRNKIKNEFKKLPYVNSLKEDHNKKFDFLFDILDKHFIFSFNKNKIYNVCKFIEEFSFLLLFFYEELNNFDESIPAVIGKLNFNKKRYYW